MNIEKLIELKNAATANANVFSMAYYSEALHGGKKTPLMIAAEIWGLPGIDLSFEVGDIVGISPFENQFQFLFSGKWEQHDNTLEGFNARIDKAISGQVPEYDYFVEGLSEIEM